MEGVGNEVKTYNIEDQPLLVKEMSDDSLFLKSDTLFFIEQLVDGDTVKMYKGANSVRFIRGDVSGSSENLIFNSTDSILFFLGSPIMWSDSTQIWGDTIKIILSNNFLKLEFFFFDLLVTIRIN